MEKYLEMMAQQQRATCAPSALLYGLQAQAGGQLPSKLPTESTKDLPKRGSIYPKGYLLKLLILNKELLQLL